MERSKTTKKIVLMAVSLATGGMILTSLFTVWDLAKPLPPAVKASTSSQDAQIAAKENEFLALLKKDPKNPQAIKGMEQVVEYYGYTGNKLRNTPRFWMPSKNLQILRQNKNFLNKKPSILTSQNAGLFLCFSSSAMRPPLLLPLCALFLSLHL
jgi:hypothetical protein